MNKTPQFKPLSDTENALLCPHCGSWDIHHMGLKVYDRAEDEKYVTVTTVSDGLVGSHRIPQELSGNPSSRRDGLAITFYCEHCPNTFSLTIAQHKGQTFFSWVDEMLSKEDYLG